jgi:hypothetical protein
MAYVCPLSPDLAFSIVFPVGRQSRCVYVRFNKGKSINHRREAAAPLQDPKEPCISQKFETSFPNHAEPADISSFSLFQSAQVLPSILFFSCTHAAMTDSHKHLCLFSIQATTAVVVAAMTIVVAAAAVTAEVAATAVTDIKRYYLDPTSSIFHEFACALRVLN